MDERHEWMKVGELREYLELALEGRRRIKEQLKKIAPHEYGKTSFSYIEHDTDAEFWVEVPEQPDHALDEVLEEEKVYAAPDVVKSSKRRSQPEKLSTRDLLFKGESRFVEFKSTARWNLHMKSKDESIEREIVKAVSGFMNAHGGTLLIGVNDSHEVVGLENDYKLTKKRDRDPRDTFENWLTDLFDNSIGKPALANMSVAFESLDGGDVCRIDVAPSGKPVYARGKQVKDFYVRLNNGTRSLDVEEAMDYIASHSWSR